MKTIKKVPIIFTTALALILFISCDKKETIIPVPVLTTITVTDITENSAISGGEITSDEGSSVTDRGVCWKKEINPTISDNKTSNGTGIGKYTSEIIGLSAGTTYYVRAYATNSSGTSYGNTSTFKTLAAATTITDVDGNVYKTVNIGTQTWMAENLRTTKYRNGESISNVEIDSLWKKSTFASYCNYNNLTSNGSKYGRLYNWFAVNETKKIAPLGWHIPTAAEWQILIAYLGGEYSAGAKLKEAGTANWNLTTESVTNESKFTALPGGARDDAGVFALVGKTGYWWTASEYNSTTGILTRMFSDDNTVENINKLKTYGLSVRCIKDVE